MSTAERADTDTWYSVADLARRFGVGRATVFRWIQQGRIPPPVKLGWRTTRWPPALLRKELKSGPQPAGTYGDAPGSK